jgi:uncharacterized membrane protein YozB (DUF420 family)
MHLYGSLGVEAARATATYHDLINLQRPPGKDRLLKTLLSGPHVILGLKVAVIAVTILLLASLLALARGKVRLHGRINLVFFVLTVLALFVFEVVIRFLNREVFDYFNADPVLRHALNVHLCFSVPSALLMPAMLYTGLSHRRTAHLILAFIFGVLWFGTFITGVFFLPHSATP